MLESLKPLNGAYHNQGYLDATIQAVPTLNPSTYHVAYAVSVLPGDQYHVRSINAVNLSPEQRKDFERGWTLKPGALYNESYVANFLTNNTALRTLENYSATYKAALPLRHRWSISP